MDTLVGLAAGFLIGFGACYFVLVVPGDYRDGPPLSDEAKDTHHAP